jgi:hypothetical protein
MNNTLPTAVQEIMCAFESKRAQQGLEFTPPEEKAHLGRYAFAPDAVTQILIGVTTAVLADIAKALFVWAKSRMTSQKSPDEIVTEAMRSAHAIEEGIRLLSQQGIRSAEAKAALELLKESISDAVVLKPGEPPGAGSSKIDT